jgi:hypothetical protein
MSEVPSIMYLKMWDIQLTILDVTPLSMATLMRAGEIRHFLNSFFNNKLFRLLVNEKHTILLLLLFTIRILGTVSTIVKPRI